MPHKKKHKLKCGSRPQDFPTVVYPKEKMEVIERIIKESEEDSSNSKTYARVEEMIADLTHEAEVK